MKPLCNCQIAQNLSQELSKAIHYWGDPFVQRWVSIRSHELMGTSSKDKLYQFSKIKQILKVKYNIVCKNQNISLDSFHTTIFKHISIMIFKLK